MLILRHLYTLSDESSDPESLLHNYIPLLLQCTKSPVMKTRIYIAKSIASIVNLYRYPNLIKIIFENHLETIKLRDNNKFHGLLEVLNHLIEKNYIFKFIQEEEFFDRLMKITEIEQ